MDQGRVQLFLIRCDRVDTFRQSMDRIDSHIQFLFLN